ncbi:MAG: O-antigen ligase family protein [Ilumatobacter sp.]|uniref:O-antigen ligase family protein n=1 Tax=Ilumatobacter sp. TaxID=1967498 RepID=UPI00261AF108|nr:O-antigen ligase family protein [Ilumatobacter sp.]MDJ0770833.1 O-antigen ligase family protein [Ilumatobacter sp.]
MSAPADVALHSDDQIRYDRQLWWLVYVVMVGGGLMIAAFARSRITEPFLGLSLAVLVVLVMSWTYRPRATLYITVFLTAISDIATVSWFPFVKNLSSRESISYVADALTISPLDITLIVGFAVTTVTHYARTGRLVDPSPLTLPILVVTMFVVLGFARGVVLSGGDLRVAVLEARPLFYLLLVFSIAVNVCRSPAHLRTALWWVLAGVFVQTLLSIAYYGQLDQGQKDALESLNEHGSTLGHNLIIVTALGLVLLPARAGLARAALLVALVPTVFVVLIAERRAGIASLSIGIVMLLIVLFWRHRRRFWFVAPAVIILTVGYLGVFWNNQGTVGFPAQAVKSVIVPGAATEADQNSDLYRQIEAFDVNFTIKSDPLLGIGFGRPFYRPVPLPDIAVFELNPYVPHNSVLWFWLKTGFFGFAAMFYLFARIIVLGARRLRTMNDGVDVVVTQSALLYAVMFLVYTYVDVSWDARNMVFLGLAAAICAQALPARSPAGPPPREAVDVSDPTTAATAST